MSSPQKHPRTPPGRLLVELDGKAMKIAVGADAFSIGSEDGASLVLDQSGISPRHAVIQRDGDRYEVFDLLSATGTFVNGTRVEAALLKTGDALRIGPVRLVFLLDAAPAPSHAPSHATSNATSHAPPPLRFLDEANADSAGSEVSAVPVVESVPTVPSALAMAPDIAVPAHSAHSDQPASTDTPVLPWQHGPLVPPRVVRHIRFSDQAESFDSDPFSEILVLQLRRSPFVLVSGLMHGLLVLIEKEWKRS